MLRTRVCVDPGVPLEFLIEFAGLRLVHISTRSDDTRNILPVTLFVELGL